MIDFYIEGIAKQGEKGISLEDVAKLEAKNYKYPILLALVDNQVTELHEKINHGENIEFLTITAEDGFMAYKRSLLLVMIYAMKEVLGRDFELFVKYSINSNWYGNLEDKTGASYTLTEKDVTMIEAKMRDVMAHNLPILKQIYPLKEGLIIAKNMGLQDKVDFLTYRSSSYATFYKIDWYYDYFYGPMVGETKNLSDFQLHAERGGFFLQFISPTDADQLAVKKEFTKLKEVYRESNQWAKILEANTVSSLNKIICCGKMDSFIQVNEALHEKRIAEIADMVQASGKQLVLIAGPSSSGKTTFANRLKIQLKVVGRQANIISVDNYFNDSDEVPVDKEGNPNFEDLNHVNLQLLNQDLQKLLAGETVTLPFYDFQEGVRKPDGEVLTLGSKDILIVEGIHALNDEMTFSIAKDNKYKIFISALTQLNIDNHTRISTTDNRLLRRIVRDYKFRAYSAARTIEIWDSVTAGERKHIFPYQEDADVIFNSALLYEIGILKLFAAPLLFAIEPHTKEYREARRLLRFLDSFLAISPELVPHTSILSEFIGGSGF